MEVCHTEAPTTLPQYTFNPVNLATEQSTLPKGARRWRGESIFEKNNLYLPGFEPTTSGVRVRNHTSMPSPLGVSLSSILLNISEFIHLCLIGRCSFPQISSATIAVSSFNFFQISSISIPLSIFSCTFLSSCIL